MKSRGLALLGGHPVRKHLLPFHRPYLGAKELQAVRKVLQTGWITRGEITEKFEKAFARYKNARYSLATSSCTSAIELALRVSGVGKGDEVIASPLSFVSPVNCVVRLGAKPVFVDVRADNFCLDEKAVEEAISEHTKAIICTHFGGSPANISPLSRLAKKNNIVLIEDCAHALEAEIKGRKLGTFGDFSCFSFYPTKSITTFEGGMILFKRKRDYEKAKLWHAHGIVRKDSQSCENLSASSLHYDVAVPGYKFNLTDVQSAVGLVQLKRVRQNWLMRKRIADYYSQMLSEIPQLALQQHLTYAKPAFHLFPIYLRPKRLQRKRAKIFQALFAEGIEVSFHFPPIHLMTYYRKNFGTTRGMCPVAESLAMGLISLPIYPSMSEKDMKDVVTALKKVLSFFVD